MHTGSCLCGGVQFEIKGKVRGVVACHCSQCRKSSGHFWAATQVDTDKLIFKSDETLSWFRSSGTARRAFCDHCGSTLFWQQDGEGKTSISAGAFDTGDLAISKHIYVKDKGDYYEIEPGVEQL